MLKKTTSNFKIKSKIKKYLLDAFNTILNSKYLNKSKLRIEKYL